ncbi:MULTISPECIES: alpha/beta fold hydrolase [unclassified Arthrobacter]|uniref:alpha/beta fold hydrolase n=1 Tax=unclassified Arthrobacter TaxID=235627 RepID=UPI002DF8506C|nr:MULTISPECIES: alpha/beta hydrolase [unclassified Arthrobacter]MEC5191077.1 pimeloyl-ACP methyl ester carboxylesterase [Arthrobacter sp. MP_M4]MEC5202248.1 pimeloyl-ACP methyl ester carboxylesterase [Arthrobacter sp. MP_M7]
MDIILVPGFWLDASSWEEVTPVLVAAGHAVHPLTMPGLESVSASRAGIGLRTHIDALVATIDTFSHPVVLVGHSGGGAIIHGAVDARPDRVARAIYVDSGPLGDGGVINDDLPDDGDDVPLPPWELFEDADLTDLDDGLRAMFRARAVPQPKGVAQDQQRLSNERRFEVPATVIACEFPSSMFIEMIAAGHPYVAELGRIRDAEFVDLPTGHWPQFTKPAELGQAILAAVDRNR